MLFNAKTKRYPALWLLMKAAILLHGHHIFGQAESFRLQHMAPSSTSVARLDLLILILQALVASYLPNHNLYLLAPRLSLDPGFRLTRHYQGIRLMNYVRLLLVFFFRAYMLEETFVSIFPPIFLAIFFFATMLPLILFPFTLFAVGGPNRPIPEKPQFGTSTEESLASTAAGAAAGIAASASAMQANLYSRLASAVNERGYVCFSTTRAF